MKRKSILFLILAVFIGCPTVSPLDDGAQLKQSEFLYESLTGNRPAPPTDIQVTTEMTEKGDVPTVSWVPSAEAIHYNVYRKDGSQAAEWQLLTTATGDEYTDSSINGLNDSGAYYYTVTAVDMYERESFMPNAVLLALSDPKFDVTANLISASQGAFDEVRDSVTNQIVMPENKLGVLLKIKYDEKIPSYLIQRSSGGSTFETVAEEIPSYLIQRSSGGSTFETVAEAWTPDRDPMQDPVSGTEVYYYMDVPPAQGVLYTYKITPIGEGGIVGEESDTGLDKKDGFVYPGAVIGTVESYAGTLRLPVTVSGVKGDSVTVDFKVRWSETETFDNPAEISGNDVGKTGEGDAYTLDISGQIDSLLGETLGKTVWIQVAAIYKTGGDGVGKEAIASETVEVKVIKAGADMLAVPTVTVAQHGRIQGDKMRQTVKLRWNGDNDPKIGWYRIYRTDRLNYKSASADATDWTLVNSIEVENSNASYEFEDSSISAAGTYFYKVNPTTDGVGDDAIETENNATVDAFARAAVFNNAAPTLTVDTQTSESGIPLSWTTVGGAGEYKVMKKSPTESNFTEATSVPASTHQYNTKVPGNFTFKVTPVALFTNNGTFLERVEAADLTSAEVSGAVKLSDTDWIKLVMQTMMEGQKGFKDDDRYFTRENDDGKVVQDSTGKVQFSAYTAWFSGSMGSGNEENESYQGYSFTAFEDANKAVSVTGVLYHLYFSSSFCLTYSSGTWAGDKGLGNSDGKDKPVGTITVDGIYPGEIQVFGKNNVAAAFSDWENTAIPLIEPDGGEIGIILAGDFPDWKTHMPEELPTDSWGFTSLGTFDSNTSTAYSIKRSGQSSFQNYSFSQVGALQ